MFVDIRGDFFCENGESRGHPDGRKVRTSGVSARWRVGLCEYVQHLSMFDYIAVSASMENRVTEYVDHLHEHFVDPVVIRDARYMPPRRPGYSIEIKPESRAAHQFPNGPVWAVS